MEGRRATDTCDAGCSSEASGSSVGEDGRDAMLDILEEFQRLYQGRLARLEQDPASPSYGRVSDPRPAPLPVTSR